MRSTLLDGAAFTVSSGSFTSASSSTPAVYLGAFTSSTFQTCAELFIEAP